MNILTQILRILLGLLFIFSGFIKANDPMGFEIKMDEYFSVFEWEWARPFALLVSIGVCVVEMVLGFFLLIGYRINLTLWSLVLMMIFFTGLTFYSAHFNKVTDCGCFGDFIHLKPWQSFWKDIILITLLLPLFFAKKHIKPLFSSKIMMGSNIIVLLASIAFPLYTYNFLPVFDFRAYKIGTNIIDASSIPEGASQGEYKAFFTYKNIKSGEVKEFDEKTYPWQDTLNWVYVDSRRETIVEPFVPPVHDFHINTIDGFEYTEDILKDPGYKFFLVAHSLDKASTEAFKEMNDFAQLCSKNNIPFMVLTASSEMVEDFKKQYALAMDFYIVDATQLKTMIRSNPGLMMLKGPVVVDMWHHHSFPSFSDVQDQYMK